MTTNHLSSVKKYHYWSCKLFTLICGIPTLPQQKQNRSHVLYSRSGINTVQRIEEESFEPCQWFSKGVVRAAWWWEVRGAAVCVCVGRLLSHILFGSCRYAEPPAGIQCVATSCYSPCSARVSSCFVRATAAIQWVEADVLKCYRENKFASMGCCRRGFICCLGELIKGDRWDKKWRTVLSIPQKQNLLLCKRKQGVNWLRIGDSQNNEVELGLIAVIQLKLLHLFF